MTEFFIVPFPADRRVFVDGGPNGRTNRVQSVERGSHTFDLGEPVDYMPDAQFTSVTDTSIERPQVIMFEPLALEGVAAGVVVEEAAAPPPARPVRKARKTRKAGKKKAGKKKSAKKASRGRRRVKHR